jgi:hypothetical protein
MEYAFERVSDGLLDWEKTFFQRSAIENASYLTSGIVPVGGPFTGMGFIAFELPALLTETRVLHLEYYEGQSNALYAAHYGHEFQHNDALHILYQNSTLQELIRELRCVPGYPFPDVMVRREFLTLDAPTVRLDLISDMRTQYTAAACMGAVDQAVRNYYLTGKVDMSDLL